MNSYQQNKKSCRFCSYHKEMQIEKDEQTRHTRKGNSKKRKAIPRS